MGIAVVSVSRCHAYHHSCRSSIVCGHGDGRIGLPQVDPPQAQAEHIRPAVNGPFDPGNDIRYFSVSLAVDDLDADQIRTGGDSSVLSTGGRPGPGYDSRHHGPVAQKIVSGDLIGEEVLLRHHLSHQIGMVLVYSRVDHRHLDSPPVDALLPEPVRSNKPGGRDILPQRKLLRRIGINGPIRRRRVLESGGGRRQSRLILIRSGFLCPPGLLETDAAVKVDSSYPIVPGQIGDGLICRLPRQAGYEAVAIFDC